MVIGGYKVSRKFSGKADEPRQFLGTNHAANLQELSRGAGEEADVMLMP